MWPHGELGIRILAGSYPSDDKSMLSKNNINHHRTDGDNKCNNSSKKVDGNNITHTHTQKKKGNDSNTLLNSNSTPEKIRFIATEIAFTIM